MAAFHHVLRWGCGARVACVGLLGGSPKPEGAGGALGEAAPANLVLRGVLPRPRYPCPGQFPSIGLWVWNKLALMAPALILCGRIPRDSRAITGGAAMPSAASSPPAAAPMEEMGGRGKAAPARQQCLHPSWQRPEQGGPWSHVRPCSTASPG